MRVSVVSLRFVVSFVLAGALAACSREHWTDARGMHPWTVPGVLRVGVASMPNTLDPVLRTQYLELFFSRFIFDPLIATSVDGSLEPKLAREVPTSRNGGISADGRTITYHLRSGVRWQDGAAFTSADVRFTYLAYMNSRNNVTQRSGYEEIARIDTPDSLTAIVHLKYASAPFVREFTTQGGVIPRHAFENAGALNTAGFNAAPIGTGPFKVVRWKRGDRIELVANDEYFLGKPRLRRVVIRFFPDENAAANELRTHDIDWLWGASTVAYRRLRDVATLHSMLERANAFYGVEINGSHPPLDDVRVREAISSAIDRETLVSKIAFGAATVANADLPSFLWTHDPKLIGQRYDRAAALALFAHAGWHANAGGALERAGRPLALTMVFVSGNATSQAAAVQVQSQLRAIGIAIALKSVDPNQLFAPYGSGGVLARGAYDLDWSGFFETDDPDDHVLFACAERPPNGFNFARLCDPELDAAERDAQSTNDRARRKAAYARVERLVASDVPYAFVWWPLMPQIFDTDFKGYEVRPGFRSTSPELWSIGT